MRVGVGTQGPPARSTSSAVPTHLSESARWFLDLSNLCSYLVSAPVMQGDGSPEYLLINLETDKVQLQAEWQGAIHEVAGMLLSGVVQCADAACDLQMRSQAFTRADT